MVLLIVPPSKLLHKVRPCVCQKISLFRESRIVSTVENRPKIIHIFPVQNFGKMYRNIRYLSKIDGYFRNFWHSTVSVENQRLFSRISTFSGTFRYKMALKMVKMALNMVKNYGILYRKFWPSTFDRQLSPFDRLSKMYQNIRLSVIGFPGIISRNYTEVRKPYRNAWP